MAAEGSFTAEEWIDLAAAYDGRCAYCREVATLEPDHRVGLSRGGSNRIENILLACHREFRARLADGE